MNEEIIIAAAREEVQKMAAGVRDAMAILIALTCAMTKTKRSKFIAAAREGYPSSAVNDFRPEIFFGRP